jgi:pimeloyl-ACP methyl ester carboxylesterase
METSNTFSQRRTVQIPAGALGYREVGAGQPVVLIHGLVANAMAWRDVAPPLAERVRCIAPDWPLGAHTPALPQADLTLPGQARMVVDLLDALGLDDVVLVGNGYGGDIAQVVATDHPDRVKALVLIATNAFGSDPWAVKALRWLSAPPGAGALQAIAMRRTFFQRLPITYGWVAKRPIPDDVMASYLTPLWTDHLVRRDFHRFLRGLSPRYLAESSPRLADYDRPALVVWPTEERVFPHDGALRLTEIMPNARLVSVDDSYSWIPEDQPEVLVEHLRTFLDQLTSP